MTKKVMLDLPENIYEKLSSISNIYNEEIDTTLVNILNVVGTESSWLENFRENYKVPIGSQNVLAHMLLAANHSMGFFNQVLEELNAKGFFAIEDFEYDLEENYFTFRYAGLQGSDFCIDGMSLTLKPNEISLRTESTIDVRSISKSSLEKLKQAVKKFDEPEGLTFAWLENYSVDLEADDEEFWTLVVNCEGDCFDNFPTIEEISSVVKTLLTQAGIKHIL